MERPGSDDRRTIAVHLEHPTVSCWNFLERHREKLQEALPRATCVRCESRDDFLKRLPGADVALVWSFRQEWFDRAPSLRWIVTPAAGRDYFRVQPPPGVEIDYGSFHGELMAETVLGMMLTLARGLHLAPAMTSNGGVRPDPWPRAEFDRWAKPLRGSHLVILGFGNIGRWVGRLAKPFGVRITGIRRHPGPPPEYFEDEDAQLPVERLEEVLPTAEHLVLTLPGGPATHHMVDARRIDLLPERAILYNVGRGNALDEKALAVALERGRIAGAALDVYEEEPLPSGSPLRACPNVLLLPHAAAISPNYLDLFVEEFAERFRRKYGSGVLRRRG